MGGTQEIPSSFLYKLTLNARSCIPLALPWWYRRLPELFWSLVVNGAVSWREEGGKVVWKSPINIYISFHSKLALLRPGIGLSFCRRASRRRRDPFWSFRASPGCLRLMRAWTGGLEKISEPQTHQCHFSGVVLCCGGCSVHESMLSNVPGERGPIALGWETLDQKAMGWSLLLEATHSALPCGPRHSQHGCLLPSRVPRTHLTPLAAF